MSAPASRESLLELVATLEVFKTGDREPELVRLSPCSRCHAASGDPCRRPDGSPYVNERRYSPYQGEPRYHAPRADKAIRLLNSLMVESWRHELTHYGDSSIPCVAREIRASPGYRALVRAGLLRPMREDQ